MDGRTVKGSVYMNRNMLRKCLWLTGLTGFAILFTIQAAAQSASLYGSSAPDDAAFVRVFNMTRHIHSVWAGSVQFPEIEPWTGTAYRPVNPGVHAVFVGNNFAELIARDGRFYTVILGLEGPSVIEDSRHNRADQAQIILYNGTDSETLELRTADGSMAVIPGVAPGESALVSVNPVAVDLAVFTESGSSVNLGDIGLSRGQSYALFAGMQNSGTQNAELLVIVQQAEVLAE